MMMRTVFFVASVAVVVASAGSPRHQTPPAAGTITGLGPSMNAMMDIMSEPMTGQPFDKAYLAELEDCFSALAPGLAHTNDRVWQAFLNVANSHGSAIGPSNTQFDFWNPVKGCSWAPHSMQPYLERNFSIFGGKKNISICEPCNFVSNLGFYRAATRFCAKDKAGKFPNMPMAFKKAALQGIAFEASGSAFMHGSQTQLGQLLDTRGEFVIALLAHQVAIAQLPEGFRENPILRDFSTTPLMTCLEQTAAEATLIDTQPPNEWYRPLDGYGNDVSKPIAAMVTSMLALALPDSLVNDICKLIVKILHNAPGVDPSLMTFITAHYLPTFRNATAHIKLSPKAKLGLVSKGVGGFTKFMYAVLWQEEIIKAKFLLDPWVNRIGADLMPEMNRLADFLTGFGDTDSKVKSCADDVYPGAGWCRKSIPHAKWHETTANAFVDLISLGEHIGGIYKQGAPMAALAEVAMLKEERPREEQPVADPPAADGSLAYELLIESLQNKVTLASDLVDLQEQQQGGFPGRLIVALLGFFVVLSGYLFSEVRRLKAIKTSAAGTNEALGKRLLGSGGQL